MITVCMIVKDEEKNLEECLNRLKPFGFEIVVVDTGSTDQSKEIAQKYTDKVYDFEWCNDFAKARNFSLSKASNDMVFVLDSDEMVIELDKEKLIHLVCKNNTMLGTIQLKDMETIEKGTATKSYQIERIFNRKLYQYEGKIHEQIVPKSTGLKEYKISCPVIVEHHGYDSSVVDVVAKGKRNLELILQKIHSGNVTAYDYFQAAQSYRLMEEDEKSIPYYEKALDLLVDPKPEYVQVAIRSYGYALLNIGRSKDALILQALYNEYKDNADYLLLMGKIYASNQMLPKAVQLFEEASRAPYHSLEGISNIALYNCGQVHEFMGNKEKAISCYRKCKDFSYAKEALDRILNEKTC